MMQYTNWINSTPSQQQLLSCIAQWLEHWVCNPGVASSSLTFGILTVNFSTGTRSFCVQQNHCTSRMRSQSQLRNDKYIMMQYTNWINSTPSQQQLLSCIAQWLEHWVCNPGVASSSLTFGILTVNFSTGTRSFCVQQNHCTSRMRSQSQLRNDKYIMMQYTNWINSTPSQQQLLSCIAQWLEHWVCNPGVASSSLTFGILTVNFSTGTRSFCVSRTTVLLG